MIGAASAASFERRARAKVPIAAATHQACRFVASSTVARTPQVASRSKRAEIQYTASWLEAWAANNAAASAATGGVTRRLARANTQRDVDAVQDEVGDVEAAGVPAPDGGVGGKADESHRPVVAEEVEPAEEAPRVGEAAEPLQVVDHERVVAGETEQRGAPVQRGREHDGAGRPRARANGWPGQMSRRGRWGRQRASGPLRQVDPDVASRAAVEPVVGQDERRDRPPEVHVLIVAAASLGVRIHLEDHAREIAGFDPGGKVARDVGARPHHDAQRERVEHERVTPAERRPQGRFGQYRRRRLSDHRRNLPPDLRTSVSRPLLPQLAGANHVLGRHPAHDENEHPGERAAQLRPHRRGHREHRECHDQPLHHLVRGHRSRRRQRQGGRRGHTAEQGEREPEHRAVSAEETPDPPSGAVSARGRIRGGGAGRRARRVPSRSVRTSPSAGASIAPGATKWPDNQLRSVSCSDVSISMHARQTPIARPPLASWTRPRNVAPPAPIGRCESCSRLESAGEHHREEDAAWHGQAGDLGGCRQREPRGRRADPGLAGWRRLECLDRCGESPQVERGRQHVRTNLEDRLLDEVRGEAAGRRQPDDVPRGAERPGDASHPGGEQSGRHQRGRPAGRESRDASLHQARNQGEEQRESTGCRRSRADRSSRGRRYRARGRSRAPARCRPRSSGTRRTVPPTRGPRKARIAAAAAATASGAGAHAVDRFMPRFAPRRARTDTPSSSWTTPRQA